MKTFRFFLVVLVYAISFSHIVFSQVPNKESTFLLRVESTDLQNVHVHFSSAYAYHTSNESQPLVTGEQETPFEVRVTATRFLGMFRTYAENTTLKVSLVAFIGGIKSAEAEGTGTLNILHADPTGIGYGWPTALGDLSMIEHFFDSKEK